MKPLLSEQHAGTRVGDFTLSGLVEDADSHGVAKEASDIGFWDVTLRG